MKFKKADGVFNHLASMCKRIVYKETELPTYQELLELSVKERERCLEKFNNWLKEL